MPTVGAATADLRFSANNACNGPMLATRYARLSDSCRYRSASSRCRFRAAA